MRKTLSAALTLSLLGGLVSMARAEVDVEVPAGFKAKGTLDPAEVERFRFHAVEGTALTLAAVPARKSGLVLDVQLVGTEGTVAIPAGFVTAAGGKVSWKAFPVPATDDYQVVLSGTGSGGYTLSLKAKPKTTWTGTINFPGVPTTHFLFSAPAGSTVALSAKPAKGSPVVARFGILDSGLSSTDLSMSGKVTPTGHSATVGPLVDGGDYDLTVANSGGSGDVLVSAKVKPPKVKPAKFDLRGVALGMPGGGETFVGRTLDAAGGTVTVGDAASELDGAEIVLPAGALAGPTLVSIASSLPPPIGDPDDQAAGPAVLLGPSGLTFAAPAVVTLPVDFTKIPADATIDDIRILIVEDDGSSSIVLPTGFSTETVTLETTGFSVCCPIVQSGPPNLGYAPDGTLRPGGDEYWFLQLGAEIQPSGNNDSRNRSFGAGIGQISIHGDGTFDFTVVDHGFNWSNPDITGGGQPVQGFRSEYVSSVGAPLTWAYDVSQTKILLSGSPDATPTLRISRDGKYLAGRHDAATEPRAEGVFGVRKNAAPLVVASLNGTWNAVFLELEGTLDSSSGLAGPRPTRATGTFDFDGSGGCRIALAQRRAEFNDSNGSFSQVSELFNTQAATYSIAVDGTILVVVPPQGDDQGTTLHLFPGDGLDAMVGGHDTLFGNPALGLVLVREASGLSRTSLAGTFHGAQFGVDPNSYGVGSPTVNIPDFATNDQGASGVFDGGATAAVSFDDHHVQRDTGTVDGTLAENSVDSFTVAVTVTAQGKLTLAAADGKVVGAISQDGQFFAAVTDVASANGDFGLFFLFRAPPDKTP